MSFGAGVAARDRRNRLLLGEAANKAALRQALSEKPAIVAFATHGLLPEELVCENEPALAVSPRPGESAEDGLLRAGEIIGLPLDAELVILSARNRAPLLLGRFHFGRGSG